MRTVVVRRLDELLFRTVVATAAILVCGVVVAAAPGYAAPKVGQRTSDCKDWDCSGGIVCSCCFSDGCWICDAVGDGPATHGGTSRCHWDDAARKQSVVPKGGAVAPGGGVVDPGPSVQPKIWIKPGGGAVAK